MSSEITAIGAYQLSVSEAVDIEILTVKLIFSAVTPQ
jgi:hypothetical protein